MVTARQPNATCSVTVKTSVMTASAWAHRLAVMAGTKGLQHAPRVFVPGPVAVPLNPARIAVEEPAVSDAIQAGPKLHRYIEKMPRWLVLVARRVTKQYGGDAGAATAGRPSTRDLQRRFDALDGIGQKKAAMAGGDPGARHPR